MTPNTPPPLGPAATTAAGLPISLSAFPAAAKINGLSALSGLGDPARFNPPTHPGWTLDAYRTKPHLVGFDNRADVVVHVWSRAPGDALALRPVRICIFNAATSGPPMIVEIFSGSDDSVLTSDGAYMVSPLSGVGWTRTM